MKRILAGIFFAVTLVLLLLAAPLVTRADSKQVNALRRDADITIQPNGDVVMNETWQMEFLGGPFTKGFRTIPWNKVDDIDGWSIGDTQRTFTETTGTAGTPNTFSVTRTASDVTVNWYFEPTTDAKRTFAVHYLLHGALRINSSGDQFWWKYIEADHPYDLSAAHVVIHLPQAAPRNAIQTDSSLISVADVIMKLGTSEISADGRTVTFDGGPFPANMGWDLHLSFPHGLVNAPPPVWQVTEDAQRPLIDPGQAVTGVLTLLLAIVVGLGIYKWASIRPMPTAGQTLLQAPPENLAPGAAGSLLQGTANDRAVLATLMDLARRGIIKMTQGKSNAVGRPGDTDYVFELAQPPANNALAPYEKFLLEHVFADRNVQSLSGLRLTFADTSLGTQGLLEQELTSRGYFGDGNAKPLHWLSNVLAVMVVAAVALALGSLFFKINLPTPAVVLIAAFALVSMFMSRFLSLPGSKRTAAGNAAAQKWSGFKAYLENIQKHTDVANAHELFERYLPFAIAFGLQDKWVKAFATTKAPAPQWYRDFDNEPLHTSSPSSSGHGIPIHTGSLPSLNDMSSGAFRSLNTASSGFFDMLNTTSSALVGTTGGSLLGSLFSGSGGSGGSSFGGSDSSSSGGGGGGSSGGGGGGGSSGFS